MTLSLLGQGFLTTLLTPMLVQTLPSGVPPLSLLSPLILFYFLLFFIVQGLKQCVVLALSYRASVGFHSLVLVALLHLIATVELPP